MQVSLLSTMQEQEVIVIVIISGICCTILGFFLKPITFFFLRTVELILDLTREVISRRSRRRRSQTIVDMMARIRRIQEEQDRASRYTAFIGTIGTGGNDLISEHGNIVHRDPYTGNRTTRELISGTGRAVDASGMMIFYNDMPPEREVYNIPVPHGLEMDHRHELHIKTKTKKFGVNIGVIIKDPKTVKEKLLATRNKK